MYFSQRSAVAIGSTLFAVLALLLYNFRYTDPPKYHGGVRTQIQSPVPENSPTPDNTFVVQYTVKGVRHEENGVEYEVDRVIRGASRPGGYNLVAYGPHTQLRNVRNGCILEERIERGSDALLDIRIVSCPP